MLTSQIHYATGLQFARLSSLLFLTNVSLAVQRGDTRKCRERVGDADQVDVFRHSLDVEGARDAPNFRLDLDGGRLTVACVGNFQRAAAARAHGIREGVEAADGVTFAGMAVLLLSVSLLAGYLPARRASRTDPIEALRAR